MNLRLDDPGVFYRSGLTELAVGFNGSFPAFLDSADGMGFDSAISTHVLRYQSGEVLAGGDLIAVSGVSYKVVGIPRRINSGEFQADLVKQ